MCGYVITHLIQSIVINLVAMKSLRSKRSKRSKRCSSKKRGGMFRRVTSVAAKKAMKEIFGKDPVDAADKAKQTAEKVKDALMKARQLNPKGSSYKQVAMFSSPVSFGSPMVPISGHEHHDPNALFRTPNKKPDHDEPLLGKQTRHQSAVANRTHTYAPTIYDVDTMLVPKVLELLFASEKKCS
jgi:hypothetical protein